MIFDIIIGLVGLSLMIFFHEVGHAFALSKILKEKVEINWGFWSWKKWKSTSVGTQEQINKLSEQQYIIVMVSGIIIGFIPFLITFYSFNSIIRIFVFLSYLFASKSDLKEIFDKYLKFE